MRVRGCARARPRLLLRLPLLPPLLALLSPLLAPASARAHDPFEITTDAHIAGDRLNLHVTLSLRTAVRICLDGDGAAASRRPVSPADFEGLHPAFESCGLGFYHVAAGGQTLAARSARVELTVEDDVDMKVVFPRPARGPLLFDAVYLRRLSHPNAGIVLTVTGERTFLGQQLLRPDAPTFEVPLEPAAANSAPAAERYLWLGVGHILTGYDHLLFLLALLIACRRLRSALVVITCFTVAHSVTLALAALDLVSLSPRIIEPVIAATIVFVAAENLVRRRAPGEPKGRYGLTFAFGLGHGFGFAMALKGIGLGVAGAPLVVPLLAFNLGVETGQLIVAGVLLPIIWKLRNVWWFDRYGADLVSLLVGALGVYWLVQRIT
jgi:hydrogenase/urease accessory protein HupE